MSGHTLSEEMFPDVQSELLLVQLQPFPCVLSLDTIKHLAAHSAKELDLSKPEYSMLTHHLSVERR